ncbi:MAG: hypothetical protein FJ096_06920 [Deltaproteobacteria bacterium]|nr:hypothetical protein [Deltaproteobacteria bacterium]
MNATTQSRKIHLGLAALLGLGAVAVMTTASEVDASSAETNPACSNANVVLSVGSDATKDQELGRIRRLLKNKPDWKAFAACNDGDVCADPNGYQHGVVGKVQIRTWDVSATYNGGPTKAFTVRCGAGATCNEIAKQWVSDHKDPKPAPFLWCGGDSAVLKTDSIVVENPEG